MEKRTTEVGAPTRRSRELQRRVTAEEREELVAGYSAGAGVVQLAKHFKLHRATVRKILKRNGIEPRPLGLTDPQVREGARARGELLGSTPMGSHSRSLESGSTSLPARSGVRFVPLE